jgi:hypothetical protein
VPRNVCNGLQRVCKAHWPDTATRPSRPGLTSPRKTLWDSLTRWTALRLLWGAGDRPMSRSDSGRTVSELQKPAASPAAIPLAQRRPGIVDFRRRPGSRHVGRRRHRRTLRRAAAAQSSRSPIGPRSNAFRASTRFTSRGRSSSSTNTWVGRSDRQCYATTIS